MTEWLDIERPHPGNGRYEGRIYTRCGRSGLRLPQLALGLWHNFGIFADRLKCKKIVYGAFEHGINYFDLANNYGPPPGAAEETFGWIAKELPRDEIVVSTKAGYYMWPGPFGDGGSRKSLLASLDQSLKRLGVDYVDIFYHHRPDPETPLEETLGALDQAVRAGKALYAGLSNYSAELTRSALDAAHQNGFSIPIVNQSRFNILDRSICDDLFEMARRKEVGLVAFAPLAQGLISNRYSQGIPVGSRASRVTWDQGDLKQNQVTKDMRRLSAELAACAGERGQSLAQMAISWVLRPHGSHSPVATAIVGVSSEEQLQENLQALNRLVFDDEEIKRIEELVAPFLPPAAFPSSKN